MHRWRIVLTGVVVVGAAAVWSPAATAAPVGQQAPRTANVCIAADGHIRRQSGTARCYAAPGTGNIAIARGDNSVAVVLGPGTGNRAEATGDGACAAAGDVVDCSLPAPTPPVVPARPPRAGSSGNTARASGFAQALAGRGNHNAAVATGLVADASAADGDRNVATATGESARARAGTGNGNAATATATLSQATAQFGDDNAAEATAITAWATAVTGNRNHARAAGIDACALAGHVAVDTSGCWHVIPPPVADAAPESVSGRDDNDAVALGDRSYAAASGGRANHAVAHGDSSWALAGYGERNDATAAGVDSRAGALGGNDNRARANGERSCAFAGDGLFGLCAPTGPGAGPLTGFHRNNAQADGADSLAAALDGMDNRAQATRTGAVARAGDGDDNRAKAVGACIAEALHDSGRRVSCRA